MSKRKTASDFTPGASYRREADGVLMVEIAPGQFVSEIVALGLGIKPRKEGKECGRNAR